MEKDKHIATGEQLIACQSVKFIMDLWKNMDNEPFYRNAVVYPFVPSCSEMTIDRLQKLHAKLADIITCSPIFIVNPHTTHENLRFYCVLSVLTPLDEEDYCDMLDRVKNAIKCISSDYRGVQITDNEIGRDTFKWAIRFYI